MTVKKLTQLMLPILMMTGSIWVLTGIETWTANFGKTAEARQLLGRIGLALPYAIAGGMGVIFLFGAVGSAAIRFAGWGVTAGGTIVFANAVWRETSRLSGFASDVPSSTILSYADPATIVGAMLALGSALFGLRVVIRGNSAFSGGAPRRITGARAIHGASNWMRQSETEKLFPHVGGIVVGERYRVDKDVVAEHAFRADEKDSWGADGRTSLLCFDCAFGSTHGIVFAGSGGFKTTSVTIPTALKWGHSLVVLDPSNEVAPMGDPASPGVSANSRCTRSHQSNNRL